MKRNAVALVTLLVGCGTLASPAEKDDTLPNAHAGPFRPLRVTEIDTSITGQPAPYIARRDRHRFRSPAPLDIDGDPSTLPIWLYALEGDDDAPSIVRFTAEDGRSMSREFEVVVEAADGDTLHAPNALRVDDEVWLYYGTPAGIVLRTSRDGRSFTDARPVVLGNLPCASTAEVTLPDFGVTRLPSGNFHLFLAQGDSLCEAVSSDGLDFRAADDDGLVFRSTDLPFADGLGLGRIRLAHPFAVAATSAEGRLGVRVYFTGEGEGGESFIGLAARYGETGQLVSAVAPVLRTEGSPREAAILGFAEFALVYFTLDADGAGGFPALAAGVAPATVRLE